MKGKKNRKRVQHNTSIQVTTMRSTVNLKRFSMKLNSSDGYAFDKESVERLQKQADEDLKAIRKEREEYEQKFYPKGKFISRLYMIL